MIKVTSFVFVLLLTLSGCATQSSQNSTQNFDQLKAAKTRVSLGLTYLKNGNYSQAKFNLDKALEFAPRSADANFAMAYYYQNVGELEQAESAYQFAMDLEPNNANIANSYGAFLCQNGNYEKAKEYFLKAVNTSSYISSAETYENLAMCSQSQGKPEDAVQYLRNAINHQPGRANSLYLLTQALVDTEQWQEARMVLSRYEKISQVSPQSLSMAMKIERGLGNYSAAKGYRDMLLVMFLNDPVTQTLLAEEQALITANGKATKKITKILKSQAEVSQPSQSEQTLAEPEPEPEPKPESKVSADNNRNAVEQNINSKNIQKVVANKQQTEVKPNSPATFHIVSKGENLYRISVLYNIRMQRLIEWNDLADASAIYDGKKLSLVPPKVVE
jgi:type IV pilus assembly protein PilF